MLRVSIIRLLLDLVQCSHACRWRRIVTINNMSFFQFIGAPCGSHGPYTFYKAFKFKSHGKINILSLGEFFFLKILDEFPVCIGEIQLLWEEKGTNQLLASVRLYFQPRDTPGGPLEGYDFGDVSFVSYFVYISDI